MPIDLDGPVAGEPLRLLLQALAQLEMTPHGDGSATVTGAVEPEARAALERALDRIRAESATEGGRRAAERPSPSPAGDALPDAQVAEAEVAEDEVADAEVADAFTVLLRRILDAAEA